MNLHEYQGKELLSSFGVTVQRGIVAKTAAEAVDAGQQLTKDTGTSWHVVKAQIHAGGRGKGGGVKLAKNLEELGQIADDIIGMQLITPQTPPEGKKVNQVLVAEDVYYPGASEPSEFYISVLLNRATGKNMIMYSTEGGMDIESVAEKKQMQRVIDGEIEMVKTIKEHQANDFKDEIVLILISIPLLVAGWGVFSNDPEIIAKLDSFFDQIDRFPLWLQGLIIGGYSSVLGIKGVSAFKKK